MKQLFRSILLVGFIFGAGQGSRAEDEMEPKPINMKSINTKADETDPHPASHSRILYYSSNAKKKWDLMIAGRRSTREMYKGARVVGGYISTEADDRTAFITPEGKYTQYLFFATKKDKNQKNFDIYAAQRFRAGVALTAPTPLQSIATAEDEMHPWLTRDGLHLFFSRKTKLGWQIMYTSRARALGALGFAEPKVIKDFPTGFRCPTLTPDSKTIFMEGPVAKGRYGIYVSKRSGGKWSRPQPINLNQEKSKIGERSPCLSRSGAWLYFASDREGGQGGLDIWIVRTSKLKVKK